jgi:hypothetical protein
MTVSPESWGRFMVKNGPQRRILYSAGCGANREGLRDAKRGPENIRIETEAIFRHPDGTSGA